MKSSELLVRVEKLFLKGKKTNKQKKKTEAASGLCRENARYIEILELMTLKILAKQNDRLCANGYNYCANLCTLCRESEISSFLAIICIIIITIKCFTQL